MDTEPLHLAAWRHMLRRFGKDLSEEEYVPMTGRGSRENMRNLLAAKGVEGDHEELHRVRRQKYEELRRAGIAPIARNIELAWRFKKEYPALVQAAVSSARRGYVDESLAAAGLDGFFAGSFSLDDRPGLRPKPAPDLYLYACEALRAGPAECLAFEDSANGAAAAEAAGIRVLRLPTALAPAEILAIYK